MDITPFLNLLPALGRSPKGKIASTYDAGADVLYVSFDKTNAATDSELPDDDVILRYDGDELTSLTILHADARRNQSGT